MPKKTCSSTFGSLLKDLIQQQQQQQQQRNSIVFGLLPKDEAWCWSCSKYKIRCLH
jgi:hypothetical protein